MRITYRTLAKLIDQMSEEQKDSDLTIEDCIQQECFAATLRIAGENHDSLEDGHPVIYLLNYEADRSDNIKKLVEDIGL